MRALLAGALLVGALVGVATHHEPEPVTCAEDDPCWDCESMGNGLCGPQPAHEGLAITSWEV